MTQDQFSSGVSGGLKTEFSICSAGCLNKVKEPRLLYCLLFTRGEGPHGVMVKAMDCGIVVSEIVLQSRYYIHFRANTLGKGMNPLIFPTMG